MDRELKIWGERWLIREDSTHAISYLKIKKGYRCSWHVHKTKYNLFVILKGNIELLIEEMGEVNSVFLKEGEEFTIKPGQWHEFQGKEDSEIIEEMYVKYDESDIIRKEIGGKIT